MPKKNIDSSSSRVEGETKTIFYKPGSFSLLFLVCMLQFEDRLRERACLTPPVGLCFNYTKSIDQIKILEWSNLSGNTYLWRTFERSYQNT